MMDLGVTIPRDTPEAAFRAIAQLAEQLDFCGVWVNHPPHKDGFGPLAWAAQAARRVMLSGSGGRRFGACTTRWPSSAHSFRLS